MDNIIRHKNDDISIVWKGCTIYAVAFYEDSEGIAVDFDFQSTLPQTGIALYLFKEKLNLTYEVSWINKTILDYMLAICKLKDGITKSRQFTYDEVMEHYLKFEKTIPPIVKASYKRYFDRMDNNKYTYVKRPNINEVIICDILKEKYKFYVDVSSLRREQVINLLKKYYKGIDSSIRDELMYLFNITEKEFMSGKKLNHLYRILNNLDNKILLEKNSSYKKQMNRK